MSTLLTHSAVCIPYSELLAQPVGPEVVDELLKRYDELPAVPYTNKLGLAHALAFVGDARVVQLFRRVLFEDYRNRHLTLNDGLHVSSVLVLNGHLAARYPQALDLLRDGLSDEFWETHITWSIDDVYPVSQTLVNSCILGLALTGRDDAWDWVLARKLAADPAYLARHAGKMVDAAASRRNLLDHGRAYVTAAAGARQLFERFELWADTPEGKEWLSWFERVERMPRP